MEAGTSVKFIPNPMPSLYLRRDTMIVFAPLAARLLIGTSVSWATTIPCWNMTGKNAPALNPNFIVAFATVSVHPVRALGSTEGNVASEKLRQQNVRVEMCQMKYLLQFFWIVIY